jgi:tRNA G46 methylase TrmB
MVVGHDTVPSERRINPLGIFSEYAYVAPWIALPGGAMNQVSSPVSSSQTAIHPRLEDVVRRHAATVWRRPLHAPTVAAFERLLALEDFEAGRDLVFDSGCGTGVSTSDIAARHADCLVIGIDRSLNRLSRQGRVEFPSQRDNAIWIQAELSSFWRLALENGWRLKRHYLLYPNPWPKPGQLKRRWHAHPVFPQMLTLGGMLELRCNWKIYAEEFQRAVEIVRPGAEIQMESADSEQGWDAIETPFGRKYARSGHRLYRLIAALDRGEAPLPQK